MSKGFKIHQFRKLFSKFGKSEPWNFVLFRGLIVTYRVLKLNISALDPFGTLIEVVSLI